MLQRINIRSKRTCCDVILYTMYFWFHKRTFYIWMQACALFPTCENPGSLVEDGNEEGLQKCNFSSFKYVLHAGKGHLSCWSHTHTRTHKPSMFVFTLLNALSYFHFLFQVQIKTWFLYTSRTSFEISKQTCMYSYTNILSTLLLTMQK